MISNWHNTIFVKFTCWLPLNIDMIPKKVPGYWTLWIIVVIIIISVACQAPVVQTMDSTVHRTNHYPADKHQQNQLNYPVDSDLSTG